MQSFPSCTVTVYYAVSGLIVPTADIYSDNAGTNLGNPFTSASDGFWFFYADNGRYNVRFSGVGSGIATPFTRGDYLLDDFTGACDASAQIGADAGAKIAACIALLPATGGTVDARGLQGAQAISAPLAIGSATKPVKLLLGAVALSSNSTITTWPNSSIEGQGDNATRITYTATGDAIAVRAGTGVPYRNGGIRGILLVGTAAAANAIHQIDSIGVSYEDVSIRDFTGATASGILFDNATSWNERFYLDGVSIHNCTNAFRFLRTGGTDSFMYGTMRNVHFGLFAGQTGMFLDGSGGFVSVWNGRYQIFANMDNTAGSSTFMKVRGPGLSEFSRNVVDIQGEVTFGGPGVLCDIDATSDVENVGTFGMASTTNSITAGGFFKVGSPLPIVSGIMDGTYQVSDIPLRLGARIFNDGLYLIPPLGAPGGFRNGIGFNAYWDGTNWRTNADGAQNGGVFLLNDSFYFIPSIGGSPGQTITNANLNNYKVLQLIPQGLLVTSPGTSDIPSVPNSYANGDKLVLWNDALGKLSIGMNSQYGMVLQSTGSGVSPYAGFHFFSSATPGAAGTEVATILPTGINSTPVGSTTPSTGAFTTLTATTPIGLSSGGAGLANAATQQTAATNGTQILAGACQSQTPLAITGVVATSKPFWSLPNAPVATWRTGITVMLECGAGTVTPWLCNPTAGSITPAAQILNIGVLL